MSYVCSPGHRVAIVGRREVVLQEAAKQLRAETGASVTGLPGDLSVHPHVERAKAGLLGLVAVAGLWRANFEANVLTAVLLTQALLPHLSSPRGRVITISSIAGMRGGGDAYSGAAAVLYLASPDASFVTGQVLQVNGGALLGR